MARLEEGAEDGPPQGPGSLAGLARKLQLITGYGSHQSPGTDVSGAMSPSSEESGGKETLMLVVLSFLDSWSALGAG